jgi:hypothetical protein
MAMHTGADDVRDDETCTAVVSLVIIMLYQVSTVALHHEEGHPVSVSRNALL